MDRFILQTKITYFFHPVLYVQMELVGCGNNPHRKAFLTAG